MTTLTFDLAELDRELGDLLAHHWTVRLFGEQADTVSRVIAPPPSETVLTYSWEADGTVAAFAVLCDGEVTKRWALDPAPRFFLGDTLQITLRLTT